MIMRNRFIEKMDKLIALLSAKKIRIVPGTQASTDGEGTIYMPWLPNDATEVDFIKFFTVACHKQAHFYGKTRVHLMSEDTVIHRFENVFDDIRCEYLQEKEYPGLRFHRIKYYKIILDEFVNKEFITATTENIGDFIKALGKYIIIKNRINQLDTTELIPTPSDELVDAYNKYAADFEPRVIEMKTDFDAFKLGHELYERVLDLIKKIEEEKLPPPPPSKDKSEEGEPDEGESGEGESEEGKSDEGKSDEGKSDEGKSDEDESGEDESGEDESGESESGEEKSEKGDDDGSGTDESDSDSDDSRGGDKSSSGELPEDETESDGDDDESIEGTDDGDDDKGEESSDPSDSSVPKDGGEATESDDGSSSVEPEDDAGDDDEERKEALKKAVERALKEIEEGEPIDFITRIVEKINLDASRSDQYMVDPNVHDDIDFNRVGSKNEADLIKNQGLKILGVSGSRMIRLFINQSKPSYLHYQKSGRFDGRALVSDPLDRRLNVYSIKMTPRIEKAAVSFMMDNSGSMRSVIKKAYAILSGLTYHLSRGNVPVEAVGFTAYSCRNPNFRDVPVQLRIIKTFNEPYSGDVARRFVIPSVLNQNAEVDCMRFMIPRLMARPEQKKVFFVIGDGMPCIGNGNLNRKLARTYKEYVNLCRAAGIIVFGFGINCDLSWIFGEDFISVDREDMGDQIMKKLSEVLNHPTKRIRRAV